MFIYANVVERIHIGNKPSVPVPYSMIGKVTAHKKGLIAECFFK